MDNIALEAMIVLGNSYFLNRLKEQNRRVVEKGDNKSQNKSQKPVLQNYDEKSEK